MPILLGNAQTVNSWLQQAHFHMPYTWQSTCPIYVSIINVIARLLSWSVGKEKLWSLPNWPLDRSTKICRRWLHRQPPHLCQIWCKSVQRRLMCKWGGGKCDAFRSVDQTDQKQKYSRFLAWKTIAHRSLYKETGDDVSNDVVRIFTRSIMEYVQVYVQWKYRAKNNLKCRQIAEIFNLITQNQCRWERRQHQSSDRK